MGAFNTIFNYESARANRYKARTLAGMAATSREQELRARGWIGPGATLWEIAEVEAISYA